MDDEYIIQVAPLIPLPFSRLQIFSYLGSEKLQPGTLVKIPFYYRETEGIVISVVARGGSVWNSLKLKRIFGVTEDSFLTARQIDFAKEFAAHYLASLGTVFKAMVPRRMSVRPGKKANGEKSKKIQPKLSSGAKNILNSQAESIMLKGNFKNREKVFSEIVSDLAREGKQCLILVPEIYFAHSLYEDLRKHLPEEKIAVMHSKIPKGQFYHDWKRIKEGRIQVVISSKIGVFLPFSNLGMIIIKQEIDPSHKQTEMNPRYSAVYAAEILAKVHKAKIIFDSPFYSVSIMEKAEKGKIGIVNLTEKKEKNPEVESVDLGPEKRKADFPISEILYKHLAEVAEKKGKSLLIVNRRGYSTLTVCKNCREILRCPDCKQALVYFEKYEKYCCLHCSFKVDLLSSCPKCGGFQFSHFGVGIQLVEKTVKKMFPAARIERIDSDVMKSAKKYKKIHGDFEKGKINILVGTQIALKSSGFEGVDLVGIALFGDFSRMPDLYSRELALSRLFEAKERISDKGKLVIQSFFPNDDLFAYLKGDDLGKFQKGELQIRKKLNYPPYANLIKLTYQDKLLKNASKKTAKAFDLLKALEDNNIDVNDPYEPVASKRRSKYSSCILIKMKSGLELKDLPIRSVISGLGKGWIVDIDPVSTI